MIQYKGDQIQPSELDPAVITKALSREHLLIGVHQRSWEHPKGLIECNTNITKRNRFHTCCFRRIWSCSLLLAQPGTSRDLRNPSVLRTYLCSTPIAVSCPLRHPWGKHPPLLPCSAERSFSGRNQRRACFHISSLQLVTQAGVAGGLCHILPLVYSREIGPQSSGRKWSSKFN